MRRIVLLPLCIFIVLITAANAEMFKCVNITGTVIMSNYILPDAKCESVGGGNDSVSSHISSKSNLKNSGKSYPADRCLALLENVVHTGELLADSTQFFMDRRDGWTCTGEGRLMLKDLMRQIAASKGDSVRLGELCRATISGEKFDSMAILFGRNEDVLSRLCK